MRLLRNALAVVGLLALVVVGYGIFLAEPYLDNLRALDSRAPGVYADLAHGILETGDFAEASVYKRRVDEGVSVQEVEERLRVVADEENLQSWGQWPGEEAIREIAGEHFPVLKSYVYCDAAVVSRMVEDSPAAAVYLPCRIVLQEDVQGDRWLMIPDLDPLIHGGHRLPDDLREQASGLRQSLHNMIDRAATGAF